jgi:hypothetical protein
MSVRARPRRGEDPPGGGGDDKGDEGCSAKTRPKPSPEPSLFVGDGSLVEEGQSLFDDPENQYELHSDLGPVTRSRSPQRYQRTQFAPRHVETSRRRAAPCALYSGDTQYYDGDPRHLLATWGSKYQLQALGIDYNLCRGMDIWKHVENVVVDISKLSCAWYVGITGRLEERRSLHEKNG